MSVGRQAVQTQENHTPEEPVGNGETEGRWARTFQYLKLVPKREILQVQRCARPKHRTERQKDVYDDGFHRPNTIRP
jgi:hypothetical protein